jgi:hypothetical protein
LLGLLDTVATGIFVKREALKGIDHQVEQVNLKVKGRYSHSQLKEIAIFDMKLPDFVVAAMPQTVHTLKKVQLDVMTLCLESDLSSIYDLTLISRNALLLGIPFQFL